MLTKEMYYQILDLHNEYAVNETYRRLDNEAASDAYKELMDNKYHVKSIFNKFLDFFKTWNFLYFIKSFLGWLIFGYLVGCAYVFYQKDIYNVIMSNPGQTIESFSLVGIHSKVFMFLAVVYAIKFIFYFLRKKSFSTDKIAFEPMDLEKAYHILRVDQYDNLSFIKLQVCRLILKNKHEVNNAVNAYLTVMEQYSFEKDAAKPTVIPVLYIFIKNILISIVGSMAKTAVFVPVLYVWVYYYYNLIVGPRFLPAINSFLQPVYDYVMTLPFKEFIPFMNSKLNHIYALVIVIGLALLVYEIPALVVEIFRQFNRGMNFGKAYTLAEEIELPEVSVYTNRFKNKFNITRMTFIFCVIAYFAYTSIMK